jgi:hypothetical protein|tara:strand:- start:8105 stop:9871 length:1767 start_codon:yes stop_codon:yes gene_type:complete
MANIKIEDPELEMLVNLKTSHFNYRKRRQDDWTENYTLYRDKVTINRLTQRQSVNLPLMKMTIRTLLKDVDDMPVLYFENLDNDKQAETFQNEYWKKVGEVNKMDLKDIIDKRQVFHYGRSFDQMQITNGMPIFTIQDPTDMLIDRFVDPADIDTARSLIHTHIFVPLSSLENNPAYDKKAVAELINWHGTEMGLIKEAENQEMLSKKNEKMADMGLEDIESPILGEAYVELSLNFVFREKENWHGTEFEDQIFMYVTADDQKILQKAPLEEVIGKTKDHYWQTHYPYNTWADDVDRQDFWSDGIADIVRTPNKVLNSWFSQLVENRTLRNFGMHYYDSTAGEDFNPQTFNAIPWGWYGVPGKPQDLLQKVDIPDLSEALDEMTFVATMIEKATGATSTQQGSEVQRQITLGEVQLALGEAKERIKGMSKFYTPAWKSRGEKFLKLIEAAPDKLDAVKIYKKGRNTDEVFSREIEPTNWMTKSGYKARIWSQDEKNTQDGNALQKLNATVVNMPNNPKLLDIYQRKLLEFADLTPEENNEVMDFEREKRAALINQPLAGAGADEGVGNTGQVSPIPLSAGQPQPQPTA